MVTFVQNLSASFLSLIKTLDDQGRPLRCAVFCGVFIAPHHSRNGVHYRSTCIGLGWNPSEVRCSIFNASWADLHMFDVDESEEIDGECLSR